MPTSKCVNITHKKKQDLHLHTYAFLLDKESVFFNESTHEKKTQSEK